MDENDVVNNKFPKGKHNMDGAVQGRYGETGYLYTVHYPVNPETYTGKACGYIAVLKKYRDMGEY